jgi:hypothetical protein
MGYRKTGVFQPAEQIVVLTCDVCERNIGYEDGRRPRPHLRVTQHPSAGPINDQHPPAILCSSECLRAYAASSRAESRVTPPWRPWPTASTSGVMHADRNGRVSHGRFLLPRQATER